MNRALNRVVLVLITMGMARIVLAVPALASYIRNPASGDAPLAVNVDASSSSDPNGGTITQYAWDFGDGQQALGMTVPTISHTYLNVGTYTSTLTITTSGGLQAAASLGTVVFQVTPAALSLGTTSGAAGSNVSLPMTFTASPDIGAAGFQFDLTLPPSVTYTSTTLGPVTQAAAKQVFDNPAIPRVIIIGFNQTVIASGLAALVNLQIAPGTPAGSIPIPLINLVVTDPNGNSVPITGTDGSITVTPSAPVITSSGTAAGAVGTAFIPYQITATNSPATFGANGLPPGLAFTGGNMITGTPTQAGTFSATITATNVTGTGSATLVFTIAAAPPPIPVITSAGAASGIVGTTVTPYQITATNNPILFGASGLPPGLGVNSSGSITGIPTQAGTFNSTVTATNVGGAGSKVVAFTINLSTPVITSPGTAVGAVVAVFTPYQITATNSPTSFGAGGLPPGLAITGGNMITGTPTQAGTFSATLTATNVAGTGSATLVITIAAAPPPIPVITSAGAASGIVGTTVTPYQITATNNPTSFGASALPPGLGVNSSGSITGIPTQAGTFNATVTATNVGGTDFKVVVFTVNSVVSPLQPPVIVGFNPFAHDLHTDDTLSLILAGGPPDSLQWVFTPEAPTAGSASAFAAAPSGVAFPVTTASPSLTLSAAPQLSPGPWHVSVTAVNGAGTSAPAQADFVPGPGHFVEHSSLSKSLAQG